jgi:peptide/nickel transport system substrate-binding protein
MSLALALLLADTLVVGLLSDPVSLDPHRATDTTAAAVLVNVCESLVRYRPGDAEPHARLATTWSTRDAREWTFSLRTGVRFHDGTAFDADAVVANLESLRKERAFPGRAMRLGTDTVAITLERADAALLATLAQPFYCMQSPRELARPAPRSPVGTGPFRLASSKPGLVELEADPGYWGGRPLPGALQYRRYASPAALAAALTNGEVDVTSSLDPEAAAGLRPDRLVIERRTGLDVVYLALNHQRPPFSDVRVRQALARSIDRPGLVREVLQGHGQPAHNPLPPSLPGYSLRTRQLGLDRETAHRLLAAAGLHDGFSTTLLAVDSPRPYLPHPMALAERLRSELAQVQVRARPLTAPSWAAYLERITRGDFDMAVLGWQADSLDPNDFLSSLLASEAIGSTNRSRYSSPEMDTLLKRGRRTSSLPERIAIYGDVQALFQHDMPWVPLYHLETLTVHQKALRGVLIDPTGVARLEKAWRKP